MIHMTDSLYPNSRRSVWIDAELKLVWSSEYLAIRVYTRV
jgi:hypothetical protein